MKIFVATDVHGSAYWAQKVKEKFLSSQCDVMVLLGDVYNHGPRNPFPQDYAPMRTAEIFSTLKDRLLVVKGNCDSEVDEMISDFDFLPQEALFAFGRRLFFTHGHVYNKDNLPRLLKGDVLFYGHFHVNEIAEKDGVICVNVGSCALPKDGHNSYCIVGEQGVTLFDMQDNVLAQKLF